MKHINILDSDTINKIAAGEVVERPSSVVKELVENAIDAKASAITVEIKDGGTTFIRVTDNGSGIDRDDIDNAFLRHATSKIKTALDLVTIGSLGFRGEALSSIVAVSQVELITKTHVDLLGVRCVADGGQIRSKEDIGCPDGTTLIVRNLFFNTPARKKFLKTSVTEAGYIADLMNRMALSRPDISFKFITNDQTKLHTSGNTNLKDIIYQIYGRDLTSQLLPVDLQTPLMKISGFIGKPIVSRGNRTWENYFINQRYIKSPIVTKALEDAYKTFVMIHKYPFTAFHIEIDPSLIDVNVHPRKMELKFTENEAVYQQVYDAIRSILEHKELIPSVTLVKEKKEEAKAKEKAPEPFELKRLGAMGSPNRQPIYNKPSDSYQTRDYSTHQSAAKNNFSQSNFSKKDLAKDSSAKSFSTKSYSTKSYSVDTLIREEQETIPVAGMPLNEKKVSIVEKETVVNEKPVIVSEKSSVEEVSAPLPKDARQMDLFDGRLLDKRAKARHRLIGQVFDTYWMIEYDQKLFIIDQHAAHEKVLFERFSKAFSQKADNSQLLSPPVILTLSMIEIERFKRYESYFKDMGFEIEPFGGKEYAIYAVPLQLFGMNAKDIFIEILDSLSDESGSIEGSAITYKIATMACKAAVKGGSLLSVKEADALIEELLEADNPYTCPHGRPTIISISKYEMEKKFKRIQD